MNEAGGRWRAAPAAAEGQGPAGGPRVLFLITDAGSGHRVVAETVVGALRRHSPGVTARLENAYEAVWPQLTRRRLLCGVSLESLYTRVANLNWMWLVPLMRSAFRRDMRRHDAVILDGLVRHLSRVKPDAVVSFMPFVNDFLARACRALDTPFGIVLTDLADTAPPMWFAPAACTEAAFLAVYTETAARQARRLGALENVLKIAYPVPPKFDLQAISAERLDELRHRLGLTAGLTTVLLMMGGHGSRLLAKIIGRLEACPSPLQIVAACGRDEGARRRLLRRAPRWRNRVAALGYTDQVHLLMALSDVLISKPGTATVMEARRMGLPLVIPSSRVLPQEEANLAYVQRHDLGTALDGLCALPAAVLAAAGRGRRAEPVPPEDPAGRVACEIGRMVRAR